MTKEEVEKIISTKKGYATAFYRNEHSINISDYAKEKKQFCITTESGIEYLSVNSGHNGTYRVCKISDILAMKNGKIDTHPILYFGSDPELFYTRAGVMIPSTQVIIQDTERVTRDGFQVELHPSHNTCRQSSGTNIASCIRHAKDMGDRFGAKLSFKLAYTVDDNVWKKTDKKVKQFGCHPTENAQEKSPKRVSGLREKFRAGGGHIHLGGLTAKEKNDLPTIIQMMDIVVGNTLVLLDRDESNITRRKNYGRAGEYRPKPYGLEYRVPSNFWLKHYVLWSLASGLMRNTIMHYRLKQTKNLLKRFDMKDIRNAINNNDYDLALQNFMKYAEFLKDMGIPMNTAISPHNVDKFLSWIGKPKPLAELGSLTDSAILRHWTPGGFVGRDGFEIFISRQ